MPDALVVGFLDHVACPRIGGRAVSRGTRARHDLLAASLLVLLCCSACAGGDVLNAAQEGAELGKWTTDLPAAKKLARDKQLPVLLYFNGLGWCGVCEKVEKEILSLSVWQDYARDKFLLVRLDFPRDMDSLPRRVRERNEALSKRFGIDGFPTFVMLAPDAETFLGRFGVAADTDAHGFVKLAGQALQSHKGEIDLLFGKDAADRAQYEEVVRKASTAETTLAEWLAAKPKPTKDNMQRFKQMTQALERLNAEAETIGTRRMLAKYSDAGASQPAEDQALLDRAEAYAERLQELMRARSDLANWLCGRPVPTPENRARFQALSSRLRAAAESVRDVAAE